MSKTIDSLLEVWPGRVTLKTTVNYSDLITWDDAIDESRQYITTDADGKSTITDINRYVASVLPGALHFIESHTLEGLPTKLAADNFPAVPRVESYRLFVWLRDEVSKIIAGIDDEKKGGE